MDFKDTIEQVVIHPAIGSAKVGNSPDEYFIGPKLAGSLPNGGTGLRDGAGRIKRQAARFRTYGLIQFGDVVREVAADEAQIKGTVRVANKKAAWYGVPAGAQYPGV